MIKRRWSIHTVPAAGKGTVAVAVEQPVRAIKPSTFVDARKPINPALRAGHAIAAAVAAAALGEVPR